MSRIAIIVYELACVCIYFGLLFSQTTLARYFPSQSVFMKFAFLLVLFSGFFVPYYISRLNIRVGTRHYVCAFFIFAIFYVVGSWYYYACFFDEKKFTGYHSFLQMKPPDFTAVVPKPPHVFRVLCLGGSTTAGDSGTEPYPELLQRALSERYPANTIEVINGGKFFYTSQHSIIEYLFTMKDLAPDVIIFFEAINDICASFTCAPYSSAPFRKDYGHFMGWVGSLRYPKSFEQFLLSFLFADLRVKNPRATRFSGFKSLFSFTRNLHTLIESTKANNVRLIFSNQPHCFRKKGDSDTNFLVFPRHFLINDSEYADEKSWYEAMELFNRTTEDIAQTCSIPFVDQQKTLGDARNFFVDAVHTTTEGNRIRAQLFFDKIVSLELIPETLHP